MIDSSRLEKVIKVLIFIGLLSLVFIVFSQKIQFVSSDLGRHLENGKIVWQDSRVLFTNFYSYTEPDNVFINHHWLSGVIFYCLYSIGGFQLLSVFNIALVLVIFSLYFEFSRRRVGFYLSTCLSLPVIFLLSERVEVRPEIFSYILALVIFLIVERAASSKKYHYLWWLIPIFGLWANLHIYFFIGLAILFLKAGLEFSTALGRASGAWRSRVASAWHDSGVWLKFSFYAALACLANPNTWHGLLYPFNILHNYGYEIAENKSIFYLGHLLINYNFSIFKFLLILLALSFVLRYLLLKRFEMFHIFLAVFFSGLALFASRNLAVFGLWAWLLISCNLAGVGAIRLRLFERIKQYPAQHKPLLSLALLLVIVGIGIYFHYDYYHQNNFIKLEPGWGLTSNSADSADFFRQNNLSGPIFNNYDLGSALIFWLYPSERVFVDNRPEAYSAEFFTEIYKPLQSDRSDWEKYSQRYSFKTVYFNHNDSTPWARQFLQMILNNPDWSLVYFDRYNVILLNKKQTEAAVLDKLSLDLWSIRYRLRELASAADKKGKLQLAFLAQAAQQPDIAAEIYQEILLDQPENRFTLVSSAYLYAANQDAVSLNRAVGLFNQALDAGYRLPGIYNEIAMTYWRLGSYALAEKTWRTSLKLDRHDESALYYLKQVDELRRQGRLGPAE